MTLKIPSWLIFAVLIGAGILIFAGIRGCNQGQSAVAESVQWKQENTKLVQDTARLAKERDSTKKEYQDSLDFINGQLSLKKNQLISTRYSLDSADQRITVLINKHKDIEPSKDTNVTTVPNEFVSECHDCFTELKVGQQKVKLYLSQLDSVTQETQFKLSLQQSYINMLNIQNQEAIKALRNCTETSQRAEKKLAPHGQLYFSWSVLWVPLLPKMAGIGLMYQNKYRLQIGVRGVFGQYGNGFETEVNMPLSLKRK